ncbi:X2-like carbohydrate binding domain-containing protein [Paenibacillus allorhizosphaerae]|uniref:F5/8 type C domain-containing protein n=1 Tax=Paenibacillus allorhizosphaerae TaxID=2849866 RepID=A0ABM8VUD9_9BACL|nr:X2-like carbohydrate binding domain-containing protein [Paenibacillus allorhizosphaerae]CAG7658847.1 hypothetical protein PAECIP111802_07188 [Paenibacillus allorhizosphaerae]
MKLKKKVLALLTAVSTFAGSFLGMSGGNPAFAGQDASVQLYVAVTGNDSNDGSIDHPFATLEKARDTIRTLKSGGAVPAGGITVNIRGGEYRFTGTFQLDDRDSGTPNAPVVYKSYGGEQVSFTGGDTLDSSLFTLVTDPAVLQRIPQEAGGHVLQADLKAIGITDYGILGNNLAVAPELFVNGNVMTLARWPNNGFTTVNQVVYAGDAAAGTGYTFTYNGDGLHSWKSPEYTWMLGYWGNDWATNDLQIKSIDMAKKTISTYNASSYAMKAGQRFYFYNILEELDLPGEWYLDRGTGILYLYPPIPLKGNKVQLSRFDKNLIAMNNASNIVFSGLKIEVSRGNAIDITDGENNLITHCEISKMGGYAVKINGGKNNGVYGSSIYSMGNGGVYLNGGNFTTLTPAGNYADNNDIYNYARIKLTYTSAVELNGVGNRATHNKMHDAPHLAMQFRGNDHLMEYNEIYDVVKETADASAIYSGRSFVWRGNVIRYNYFHDIVASDLRVSTATIYLDDYMSGVEMRGNVFYKIGKQAFKLANGRENVVENNIVIDTGTSIAFMTRDYKPGEKNYISLMSKFDQVPYQSDIWSQRYPTLPNILNDDPLLPKRNVVRNNVIINSGSITGDSRNMQLGTFANNVSFANKDDLGFVDPANGNFQLKDDSLIFSRIPEFQQIPFAEIGIKASGLPPAQSGLAVSYIQYPQNAGDLVVNLNLNGNTLASVRDFTGALTEGTDYNNQGKSILLAKSYLEKLAIGPHSLTFSFSSGNVALLTIEVTPPASSQLGASSINYSQNSGDSSVSMDLKGNRLVAIQDASRTLTEGVDYVNNGTSVALKKAYLSKLELGQYTLRFTFSAGSDAVLILNVVHASLALNKTYFASSQWSADYSASKAFDGSIASNSRWSAEKGKVTNQFLGVDFGDEIKYNQVVIKEVSYVRVNSYMLQYSDDGINYIDIPGTAGTSIGASKTINFAPVTSQYLRLWINSTKLESGVYKEPTINEIEVYYIPQDASMNPTETVFDKNTAEQKDIPVTVVFNGNDLIAIKSGSYTLTDRDYSITDSVYGSNGSTILLKKQFLSTLPLGTSKLTFDFSEGKDLVLTIQVSDSTPSLTLIVPADITVEATDERTVVDIGTATSSVGATVTNDAPKDFPLGTTVITWTASSASGATKTATQTVTIVDTKPPVITGAATTQPNAHGWYKEDVTVHFTATDSGSGLASVTPDVVLTKEGANLTVTGTAVDKAGNTATSSVYGIRIDKTKPVVAIHAAASYKTSDSLTVTYAVYDVISGVGNVTATLNGQPVANGQVVSLAHMAGRNTLAATAEDLAGNVTVQSFTFDVSIAASVDLNPGTLNKKSGGGANSMTAYIELPSGYDPSLIQATSVKLNVNGVFVDAQTAPAELGDYNGNKVKDLMVKFDRQKVIAALGSVSGDIKVTVNGSLNDGKRFEATSTIIVTE